MQTKSKGLPRENTTQSHCLQVRGCAYVVEVFAAESGVVVVLKKGEGFIIGR
jgi:hypothetical protein